MAMKLTGLLSAQPSEDWLLKLTGYRAIDLDVTRLAVIVVE